MSDPRCLQLPSHSVSNSSLVEHDPANTFVDMVLSSSRLPIPLPRSSLSPASETSVIPTEDFSADTVQTPVANQEPSEDVHSSVSDALSPFAKVWVPTSNTLVKDPEILYPAGKNAEGVHFVLSEDAWAELEFGSKDSCDFDLPGEASPDLSKTTRLVDQPISLPDGSYFVDKILPENSFSTKEDPHFPTEYFIELHKKVRSAGTYNYAGARVELAHSRINVDIFRRYLADYDDIGVCQFLQFGFPLGLAQEIFLEPGKKNHQSSYLYYSFIDKFIHKEIGKNGLAGPLTEPPFTPTMLSPMMTSPKNPSSRRPVFDASWGNWSLNENTPVKSYLGGNYVFTFPTVLDFADMVISQGRGCLMWKIDLSRWFLQLPVDPADYDKLGFCWRGKFWWFVSYVWGTRHAGYAGQRVSTAILWILKRLGIRVNRETYNAIVYMDDFAGCEIGAKATEAFEALSKLLKELGIDESVDKACKPSTQMKFLGVEFDSISMSMRVDEGKRQEITTLAKKWARKTVATKQELQSILGKLMWVSKVVRFSRCFVARIIATLKGLKSQKQKVTLTDAIRKDFLWWSEFLPVFNGVELLIPNTVFCSVLGDATLLGGGCWNEREKEYFSRQFPLHLRDHKIYIHLKEFFVAIIATKLWGHLWEGKRVALYCDNEAVVKTMIYQKPQDTELQKCLREMLYYVCKFRFQPVFLRVSTDDNDIADYISRVHDPLLIQTKFESRKLLNMTAINIPDVMFDFVADW